MVKINENLLNTELDNTFIEVASKVSTFKNNNPGVRVLNLGVGDVSKPIISEVQEEMKKAVDELASIDTFKGYGYYYGHDFLKNKIIEEYNKGFTLDEIYISNGAKSDTTSILELFSQESVGCLFNPGYPVYRDALDISGIKYEYIEANEDNNFKPLPNKKYDFVYICSPSNPLGIAYDKEYLQQWVNYALENNCIILYDNVYNAFIRSGDVPKTIYELDNAKKVAIEFRSFSKIASFTGIRCSYYVIPNDIIIKNCNKYWQKRVMTKFNGSSYISEKGAYSTFQPEARAKLNNNINAYLENAKYIKECLSKANFTVYGGNDSPYLWVKIKNNMTSWEYFEHMLNNLGIIIIPGIIFGTQGDNYFRVSALGPKADTVEAMKRIINYEKTS